MLEFPIKRTIIIDDTKKKKRGRKKKGDGEKTVIHGTVNLPKKEPLKKLDPLPKNAKNLVIVESPAKAKTIERFLGSGYKVMASCGHLRDLPRNQFGVNIEEGFVPTYTNMWDKRKLIEDLQNEYIRSKQVYLATDPDREGEAISWHLAHLLEIDPHDKCRIMFHEITKKAILEAIKDPEPIDLKKVDAQQARRVLDRIVGYKLSPLLWKKVCKGLSAGRVQSVAVRLICEREEAIKAFVPEEYWTVSGTYKTEDGLTLPTELTKIDGKKAEISTQEAAEAIAHDLTWESRGEDHEPDTIVKVEKRKRKRQPQPPFTTSTMQQECVSKLNFGAKKTMMLAQQLYEGLDMGDQGHVGLITYMRTDSVRINDDMVQAAREFITSNYGEEYIPDKPRVYKTKQTSQDAHEAIRPTSVERTPEAVAQYLTKDQLKLYTLIWKRTVACQMKAAVYDVTTLLIGAAGYQLRAGGAVLKFDGFLKLSDKKELAGEKEKEVPYLPEQTPLKLHKLMPAEQHFTEPPPHFTEATLVKELEEKGIGRPSTYSPTIQTILDRGYIVKDGKKLVSTELGELIVNMLTTYFKDIINIPFTANLETELDEIAEHEANKETVLENFYEPFSHLLQKADKEIETVEAPVEVSDVKCEKCGRMMVYKQGRYGKFLACPGFPECRNTKPILKKIGVKCPDCGGDIIERKTKTRKVFYGCSNYPECKFTSWDKPTEQHCPKCGHILYEKTDRNGNKKLFCTNENCEDAVKTYKGKAAANAKSK